MAANAAPLFFPLKTKGQPRVEIDAHNDSLPAGGKEERTESFKFAQRDCCVPPILFDLLSEHFWEHPRLSKRMIFLPVIIPPPKAIA
jgi:hypothetical protein